MGAALTLITEKDPYLANSLAQAALICLNDLYKIQLAAVLAYDAGS